MLQPRILAALGLYQARPEFLYSKMMSMYSTGGLIQLNAHVIHARPTYSHSRETDETPAKGVHWRGFTAGIAGLFRSYPHFTDPGSAV